MEFHQGRLIDHVHLRVADLRASKRFYQAVLGALGHQPTYETDEFFAFDEFFVDAAEDYRTRVHLAFQPQAPMRCSGSTTPDWPMAAPTMDRPESEATIRAIMPRFSSTRTATMSKPSITDRTRARPPMWSSVRLNRNLRRAAG